jgi:prephenate dehydratase
VLGSTIQEITVVHTNEYAQKLCQSYFDKHPAWQVQVHSSSSEAAKQVSKLNHRAHAALASSDAAQTYKLMVLDRAIVAHDSEWPIMHFWLLSQVAGSVKGVDNLASAFVVETKQKDLLVAALKQSQLDIYFLYALSDISNTYLLDINGMVTTTQILNILPFAAVRSLGSYPIDSVARAASRDQFGY